MTRRSTRSGCPARPSNPAIHTWDGGTGAAPPVFPAAAPGAPARRGSYWRRPAWLQRPESAAAAPRPAVPRPDSGAAERRRHGIRTIHNRRRKHAHPLPARERWCGGTRPANPAWGSNYELHVVLDRKAAVPGSAGLRTGFLIFSGTISAALSVGGASRFANVIKLYLGRPPAMSRTLVKDALHATQPADSILLQGWVRTRRDAKAFSFIELNDGSSLKGLQVIVDATLPRLCRSRARQHRRVGRGCGSRNSSSRRARA